MRYLKSAAFLLLTASSSVSLLPVARAVPNSAQNLESVEDLEPESTAANSNDRVSNDQVIEAIEANEADTAEAISTENLHSFAIAQAELSPSITETPVPQFARLKDRLLGEEAEPLTIEGAYRQVQAVQTLGVSTALEESSDAITIETANLTGEPQPDRFIEPPALTLGGLQTEIGSTDTIEGETVEIEVVDQTAAQTGAQTEVAQADAENLPTLEAPDESAEPTEIESEATSPPRILPLGETDSGTEPASAGPDDSIPAPTASEETEIDELPAILFADPNPLSFPTQTEEVDIELNPTITLDQAIELAYRNSQTIQAARLSQEQAEAAVDEARAARLPTVNTQVDLTSRESTQINPFTGDADSELDTTLGGSVGISYDLLTGGARAASIRSAELNEEIATLTLEAQQEQVRLATAIAYYDLQEAGENIGINQSFLDEAARNLRDAQLRQEVGVGTRFDVLRAEVQFANARQQLIQSQSQQQVSRRDISRLLNLPPNASVSATPVARAENWPLTLEESIILAFQNRAELEQQLLQSEVSEQQRRAALAALRPQVGLFANYSIPDFFDDNNGLQDTYSFGAQLNWTIFEGGAARARARQQEIAGDIAEEQFSENLDQVRFDVEQAFFNLQASEENIATSEVAVAQAEEALALANLRLQAGVGTQLDVLTAQSELANARGNNVTAILGYNRALVSIERAISNVATPF